MKALSIAIAVIALLAGISSEAPAQAPRMKTADVRTHMARGDVKPVPGATARLLVSPAGVTVNFFTRELVAGHVYTAWWVVINKPSACASSPCAGSDVLQRTDIVDADVGYADGVIADAHGVGNFFAHLSPGLIPGGWYRRGLTNPGGAEVHIVLHDHGPMIEALKENMLRTLRGGCTDASVPAAYPPVAKADGTAGPNRCQLYQVAMFQ